MSTTNTTALSIAANAPVTSTAAPTLGMLLPVSGFPAWVKNWETLIKAHEKLLIVIVLAFAGFHFYSKGLDIWQAHDNKKVVQAQTVVATDKTVNASLSAQIADQNFIIAEQGKVDAAKLAAIKTKLDSISAAALAKQMGGSSTDPASVVLPLNIAKHDETILEQAPIIAEELDSEKKVNDVQGQLIVGLNKQLVDSDNVCKEEIAVEKVKTKKAFVKGLKIGGIAGFIAGLFVGHAY